MGLFDIVVISAVLFVGAALALRMRTFAHDD